MAEDEILKYDKWLSGVLACETYRLNLDGSCIEALRNNNSHAFIYLNEILQKSPVFIYCKIKTTGLIFIRYLEKLGFYLIDTNVIYQKKFNPYHKTSNNENLRFASIGDMNNVVQLARENFVFSRFHLDPQISNAEANKLKGEWAKNYFLGQRGDNMIVKEIDGQIAGFLQIIIKDDRVIIDQIAVDQKHQRKGIASDMIAYVESKYSNYSWINAGTQIANIPSIRLYEKVGFQLIESYYIFHYHN